MQVRIIENMLLEFDATLKEREWQRGYTHDEEDVEALVEETEELLALSLDDFIATVFGGRSHRKGVWQVRSGVQDESYCKVGMAR